jgi:hypothetical protein
MDTLESLNHSVAEQNDRAVARQRASDIKSPRQLFDAVRKYEADGDLSAADETEAVLDRILAVGPESPSPSAMSEHQFLKAQLTAHREQRVPATERARLDATRATLDQLDRDLRMAETHQDVMQYVGTITVTD